MARMSTVEAFRKLGWRNSILLIGGLFLWIGGGAALSVKLDWPDAYGFHCHGRGCLFDDLWHSPALLHDGRAPALALFAWLWSMPALVLAVWGWSLWKKRSRINFSPYDDAADVPETLPPPPSRSDALSGDKAR